MGETLFDLHVLINVCHLGKQELRHKTDKSGNCLSHFTYTTSDQFEGVNSPTVGWGFPHDSTKKMSPVWSPTAKSQAYFQMLIIITFLLVSHLPRKMHGLVIDYIV